MAESSVQQAPESTNLPALIDRACLRLAEARTSAEVLEARSIAEAALHYAKVTSAANDTHADCLRMIVRAEMRMADEIDKGQERGELPVRGQHATHVQGADMSDLGVDRRRVAEWRDVRDAGIEVVEGAINQALAEGRPPTKTDIRNAVENRPHVSNNSGNNEWYTPPAFIAAAKAVMGGIDLDPASSSVANQTVGADVFFDAETDGLTQPWAGRVWMNPPYAQPLVQQFTEAVSERFDAGEIDQACVLVNNATETGWFQRMLDSAAAVCLLRSRVRFLDPDGNPSGAPLQGQAVLYFGDRRDEFSTLFSAFGRVLVKP